MNALFAVLYFWQIIQEFGYILEFTTDTPCHLWLRWTDIFPQVHLHPILRRGLQMHADPYFCFVGWKDLEQHEPGDTLIHSFNLVLPDYTKNVWFFVRGQIAGVDSPSTGPIMHLPFSYRTAYLRWKQPALRHSGALLSYNKPMAMSFMWRDHQPLDGIRLWCYGTWQPSPVTFAIYKTRWLDFKPTAEIASVTIDHVPAKRSFDNLDYLYIPLPHLPLNWHSFYAIVVSGDPSKPAATNFWWNQGPWPGYDANEVAWYNWDPTPPWNWAIFSGAILGYEVWQNLPFYQPGPPTPEQIYYKE